MSLFAPQRSKRNNASTNGQDRSNSNGTMTWKQKTEDKPKHKAMRSSLMASKDGAERGDIYGSVILPDVHDEEEDSADVNEWLAENLVDFYNDLTTYVGIFLNNPEWEDFCRHAERHENLGYPLGVTYLWKEGGGEAKKLPVDIFVDRVVGWLSEMIENESIFPTDEEVDFPDDFRNNYAKKMYRRMFRVFAITVENSSLSAKEGKKKEGARNDLRDFLQVFKRFLYFGWHWGLIAVDSPELDCIGKAVDPTRQRYMKDLNEAKAKKRL